MTPGHNIENQHKHKLFIDPSATATSTLARATRTILEPRRSVLAGKFARGGAALARKWRLVLLHYVLHVVFLNISLFRRV